MSTVNIVILSILGVALIVCFIGLIITTKHLRDLNDRTKYKPYLEKVWVDFIEHIDDFIYYDKFEYEPNKFCHKWFYGNYEILVWLNKETRTIPTASVHTIGSGDCVLCGFNRYRSREMARKLIHNLWKENIRVW